MLHKNCFFKGKKCQNFGFSRPKFVTIWFFGSKFVNFLVFKVHSVKFWFLRSKLVKILVFRSKCIKVLISQNTAYDAKILVSHVVFFSTSLFGRLAIYFPELNSMHSVYRIQVRSPLNVYAKYCNWLTNS